MDIVNTDSNGQRSRLSATRLLVLSAGADPGTDLLRRFPLENFETVLCPLSIATPPVVEALQPDLVLVACPDGEVRDTVDACARARASTEGTVVALSGHRKDVVIARALGTGIDEFLSLPISDQELLARLGALLRRSRGANGSEATQHVGGLTILAEEQAVNLRGRKIDLSPIQFRLLACLASAPGKVLTHQTLMSRVWGAEYVDSRHYLRLYIRYLRERIEDDPNAPKMILSEWGVGYRFEAPPAAAAPA
jgi:two-component system KDP operon response regulator KdpE